jgi:hypothetical protein
LLLIIFLGGGVFGASAALVFFAHEVHRAFDDPRVAMAHFHHHLWSQLDLTDAQAAEVRVILERRHQSLLELRREIQPRLDEELTALEGEVAVVLDEAQLAKWRTLAERFRSQWLPWQPRGTEAR